MITVARLTVFDIGTSTEKYLWFTSGAHYIALDQFMCAPLIDGSFTFNQTIVSKSLTESGTTVDEGEITLINLSGVLDQYVNFGFDGREIRLWRVEDNDTPILLDSPQFLGRMGVPEFTWSEVTIPLISRQLDLDVEVSPTVFNAVFDDPATYMGGEESVQGNARPRIFGRVFGFQPPLLNNYLSLYGCNYDREGNPAPLYNITAVFSRGGKFDFDTDYPDAASLCAATVPNGHYATCLASGMFRLGSIPTGDVTVDATSHSDSLCSASSLVKLMLLDLGWVSGKDFNEPSLDSIHNPDLPCGYYIDDKSTVLDVVTLLLQSVGAWGLPDQLGQYQFGRLEGSPSSVELEVTADLYLKDSMEKLPRLTETGVPVSSLDFRHSPYWHQINESSTLPSLDTTRKARLANQWETASLGSDSWILDAYPSAESEQVSAFVSSESPFSLQDLQLYGQPYTGWWTVTGTWSLDNTGLSITGAGSVSQTVDIPTGETMPIQVRLYYTGAGLTASWGGGGTALPTTPTGGFAEIKTVSSNSFTLTVSGSDFTLTRIEITRPNVQTAIQLEAARRHALVAGTQEGYRFRLPLDIATQVAIGKGVRLTDIRYGLEEGRDFTVISREEDWEGEEVTFSVWRSN